MLEKVDLKQALKKSAYKAVFEPLQFELAALQREAVENGVPVVIVFEGWEAAGKGTCINRLVERLDPRGFKVHPICAPTDDEKHHPYLWRFATRIPRKGRIAIFDRSWYGRVLVGRVDRLVPAATWKRAYEQILQFERQLTDDGVVIVKFWLHIAKREQARRFEQIESDDALAWKVGPSERRENRRYARHLSAVEAMLEKTSTANAPWTVVAATDGRLARVKMLETVNAALRQGIAGARAAVTVKTPMKASRRLAGQTAVLDRVDLDQRLTKAAYTRQRKRLQERLRRLEHELYVARVPVVIVYEGWDAAGKGGNIKRLTQELDPRGYEVLPFAAPTPEELDHHYLWRFWKEVPKAGHLTIFDRSWYGRVMVERVEGFCTEAEWQRAYQEINEFESMLAAAGAAIVKFWLHIDRDEQLRRFRERERVAHKRWKLTDEDWRNRKKWPLYRQAVNEMLERTSTTYAPWTVIAGNDKYFARIQAMQTVVRAIEGVLG